MKSAGFKQLECDKCIFIHHDEATKKFVLVGCEVDDLIITGSDAACISRFKKKLVSYLIMEIVIRYQLEQFICTCGGVGGYPKRIMLVDCLTLLATSC